MNNREIKFQCVYQHYKTGEITFATWGPNIGGAFACPAHIINYKQIAHRQFTGLKDKNGVEIYEGDVLIKVGIDYESEEYRIWSNGMFEGEEPAHKEVKRDVCTLERFRYWLKNESFGYEGEDLESPDDWQVIGNVFQNHELLNQEMAT